VNKKISEDGQQITIIYDTIKHVKWRCEKCNTMNEFHGNDVHPRSIIIYENDETCKNCDYFFANSLTVNPK